MGTNDRTPNKQQRTRYKGRNATREILVWDAAAHMMLLPLLVKLSAAGGYLGLGRNSTGDCLLIYVKLDDWSERIPVESYGELGPTIEALIQELEA